MSHLIRIRDLDKEFISTIISEASHFLKNNKIKVDSHKELEGLTVANLFFEPSTRTRASFELAAKKMGAHTINLDINTSSRKKGESIKDTIQTLEAMNVNLFVVRDANQGICDEIATYLRSGLVINAGESTVSHPTQAILDLFTILQVHQKLNNLKIALVGDIAHSRVAASDIEIFTMFGVKDIRLICPKHLQPKEVLPNTKVFHNLAEGISKADVIIALRIQKERFMSNEEIPDEKSYFDQFGITESSLALASPQVMTMHPGPMNRGVEISDSVADGSHSHIVRQVTYGMAIRMAILKKLSSFL